MLAKLPAERAALLAAAGMMTPRAPKPKCVDALRAAALHGL